MRFCTSITASLAVISTSASPLSQRAHTAGAVTKDLPATSTEVAILEQIIYVTAAPVYVTVTKWIGDQSIEQGGIESVVSTGKSKISKTYGVPLHLSSIPMQSPSAATASQLLCTSPSQPRTASSEASSGRASSESLQSPRSSAPAQAQSSISSASVVAMTDIEASVSSQSLPTSTVIQSLHPSDSVFAKLAVYSHNVHRANHSNTEPLAYNHTLAHFAKEKVLSCIWDESLPADADGIGMNMAEGTFIGPANVTGTIEDMWYNSEIALFPAYNDPSPAMNNFQNWGHFTQVIWRASTSVGCWSSSCARNDGTQDQIGSGFFTVCMYFPAGNVGGEYADEVGTPLGKPSIYGN